MEHLVAACQQLAVHFHCSPYEFFDKPPGEIWAIYDVVLKDVKKQQQQRDD